MSRAKLFRMLRAEFPKIREAKIHTVCDLWVNKGVRNLSQIQRESGIARNTMERVKKVCWDYDSLLKISEDEAAAEVKEQQNGQIPEETPASTGLAQLATTEIDGTRLITGPQFIAWLDKMMEAAQDDDDVHRMERLFKMRNEIIDFAAEMPVTHVDIERTVGLEGLQGMDDVLVDTLTAFFDEIDHFPRTRSFLSDTFGVKDSFWAARADAAN